MANYQTFQQIQDLLNQRLDQSGAPNFNPVEVDRLINVAYDAWYEMGRPLFSKDQGIKVKMGHLLTPFSFSNVAVITLNTVNQVAAMINNFRDLAKMKGQWNKTNCRGVTFMVWRNIVPIPLNTVDTSSQDPFNRPDDEYPVYTQDTNGTYRILNILSTTVPLQVTGTYFRELQIFNSAGSPNTLFEAQDFVSNKVVEIAKVLAKTDLDDYESVKATLEEAKIQI